MPALLGLAAPVPSKVETFHAAARGFGDVQGTARFYGEKQTHASWTSFDAEDGAHASLIASKRLADLLGFGDLNVVGDSGLPGTVVALEGTGLWLLGTKANVFHELFARDRRELRKLASSAESDKWGAVAVQAYPRWLDCFDNYGAGVWVGGGGNQYVLPADFEWLSERRLAMCTLSPNESRLVGPGLVDTSIFEWHTAMAAKYGIPYRALFFPSDNQWLWNRFPLPYVRPYSGYIDSPWLNYQSNTCATSYEPNAVRDRYSYDARRRVTENLAQDPNFMGMHGCTEIPEANIGLLGGVADTPGIKELWHGYLASELGMALDTVALLHKGDRNFYSSWDEVNVPLPTDFLGWNPATCLDLRGTWQMHEDTARAGQEQHWFNPANAPADWVEGDCNDPMVLIYTPQRTRNSEAQPDYWMRRTVTVSAKEISRLGYLHIARSVHHGKPTPLFDVWLNGVKLEGQGSFGMCYALGNAVRTGENQLVFNTHGAPVPGYCFLGPLPLRPYPGMTEPENRLWFDGTNFDAWLRVRKIEGQLLASRTADPNRPLKMMATINLLDMTTRLCERYGAYQHDTGGAGGYWAPMTGGRLARSHGLPWSCEQGGPPKDAATLQGAITRYIMYGNDALDMVFGVGHYRDKPDVAAWFDQNLELIRCIGKMHLPTPPIGVLRSSRATRLGFDEPWNWDVARGTLQGIGRNFAYLEVPDLLDETIEQFPVVMDSGTLLMTQEDVAGIMDYVRAGGTFVAQHHTGRHLPEKADAWPLASALGLTVNPKWMSEENFHRWELAKIRFAEDQDLLPSLRGRTIKGSGVAINYLGKEYSGAVAYTSTVKDSHVKAVATWDEDGSMAIAEVTLGRGRIILLGTPFYHRMRDVSGIWINEAQRSAWLDEFLTSLGVKRDSWTADRDMWAEIWRSKNGVFDLYPVARNTTKGDDKTPATVRLRREFPVAELTEISALGHPKVRVAWKDGAFELPETSYEKMESRVFIAPRADIARSGVDWFQAQSDIWHAIAPLDSVRKPQPVSTPEDLLSLADGWTLKVAGQSDRVVRMGAFNTMGLLDDTSVTFEKTISIPSGWKGRRIDLFFDAEHWFWGINPYAQLYVDGDLAPIKQPLKPAPQPGFSFEVTSAAADGILTLRLEIDGVKHRMKRKQGDGLSKPHGVTGLFYLQATELPLLSEPLTGKWFAASAFNRLQAVKPGDKVECLYLETRVVLPEQWPAKRVSIESPDHLGFLAINGTTLQTPAWMTRLDVSGLVYTDGRETVIRWVPRTRHVASWQRPYRGTVPPMKLVWTKQD
jgi:hypothetical protein